MAVPALSFAAPLFLLGLAAVPLALALYLRRERRLARARDAFALPAVRPSVAPRGSGWRRHAPVAVYGLALAGLIVALARPQATIAVPVQQATVVLVADRSGSMQATDVAPTRLVAARRAAERFLDAVPDDLRVGLISFNHTARVAAAPTTDHDAIAAAVRAITPAGSTATGDALQAALRVIRTARKPGARRVPAAIVLLSDGKSVRGSDPLEAARAAREAKVPIYTVALGTPRGTIEVRSAGGGTRSEPVPPDPATLREVASVTGGEAFAAADAANLEKVYERLGSEVAKERRKREVTSAFAAGALLLLAGAAAASMRWFGRVL